MYRNILVPLDGSPLAEQALRQLEHLAAPEAHITLLQVVRLPMPVVAPEMSVPISTGNLEEVAREAAQYLQGKATGLKSLNASVKTDVIEGDDIALTIAGYATKHNCDLIAMSTHGRGGVSRLVFGSVAEDVVRHVPCPVLIIRPT